MNDLDISRMTGLLDKYCSDRECLLTCKSREMLLKYDCVIARFIKYAAHQDDIVKDHKID